MVELKARSGVQVWLLALTALGVILLASLHVGPFPLSPGQLATSFLDRLLGRPTSLTETAEAVLWNVRLPRVCAACLIGAVLSGSGAAYQGMFRNPLVSPDILSVSSGASLGALLAIYLGWPMAAVQVLAFLGGMLAVGLVYRIASSLKHRDPVLSLVLAGIAMGALLNSAISLLKILADPYTQLPAITFWMLGGLSGVTPGDLAASAAPMILGLLPLLLLRWRINLLCLGDEEASALGEDVPRLRALLLTSATLSCAASVALGGGIGWVGLVVPHVCRLLVGPNFSRLLPASLIAGAAFLSLTDTLARSVAETEIPIGIITSILGAPFFLLLLAQQAREAR